MSDKTLVVISVLRSPRIDNLLESVGSLYQNPAGAEFDVCVVVNQTKNESISGPAMSARVVHYRHNVGNDIGAWDYGWRRCPGYKDHPVLTGRMLRYPRTLVIRISGCSPQTERRDGG